MVGDTFNWPFLVGSKSFGQYHLVQTLDDQRMIKVTFDQQEFGQMLVDPTSFGQTLVDQRMIKERFDQQALRQTRRWDTVGQIRLSQDSNCQLTKSRRQAIGWLNDVAPANMVSSFHRNMTQYCPNQNLLIGNNVICYFDLLLLPCLFSLQHELNRTH